MEKMQLGSGMNSELEASGSSFNLDFSTYSPWTSGSLGPNYNQNTGYAVDAHNQLGAAVRLQNIFQERSPLNLESAPNMHGVMEGGHYQPINNGYGLNQNGQFQAINGSKNYPIDMKQPVMATYSVPVVTGATQHQSLQNMNTGLNVPNNIVAARYSSPMDPAVMQRQYPQNMNTGCDPFGQVQRLNEPRVAPQQRFVAPKSFQMDPAGISVGASQHQNLENNHEIPNLLASLADNAKEAGPEPQCDHKDIDVQLGLNGNHIPRGDWPVKITEFVVPLSTLLGWEAEFVREIPPIHIGKIEIPIEVKVRLGKKRAMQTYPNLRNNFEEHNILKHKKVQRATEDDFSYDTKTKIVQEPHHSKDILSPGIKKSINALSGDMSMDGNQTARGEIEKGTCIDLSPQMAAENVDSMHQISQPSQHVKRQFSIPELILLVNAADKFGVGAWKQMKQEFFFSSDRSPTDLKEKWRSLVQTAKASPGHRKGHFNSSAPKKYELEKLLKQVEIIEARKAQ